MTFDFDVWWGTIYVWWGTQVLKGCGRVTTRAFALDTGFWTCNDMPKRERSAAQARAEAVYRRANPDDKGDRGRDRRAEKVEYRRRLKKTRAEAAALAVPDAAPAALVPVPIPSTVPRPRALGQHGRGHLLVARQPSLALPPPLAALPPTIAPRLVAPIPPLAPTASRYGGLALRDIAFGSSQGRLGKGGQGTVRLGRHYGGRLAVKQPLRASSAFASECQIAAALHHENIIYVMGFACAPRETPFLALDYADAGTLGDLLIGDQRGESRSLGVQIARAMSYLHTRSPPIVHLDLKPSNVLLSARSEGLVAKLCDFGQARRLAVGAQLSHSGTPGWRAPEQVRVARDFAVVPLSRGTDAWSLGCVLAALEAPSGVCDPYHFATGDAPGKCDSRLRYELDAIVANGFTRPCVPDESRLAGVVSACTHALPSERATCAWVRAELEQLLLQP